VFLTLSGTERRATHFAETDEAGRFEFKELPADSFMLRAEKKGYVQLEYGQRRPFEDGRPIRLAEGETLEKVDIAVPRASAITGRVTDENGEPIEGAVIEVWRVEFFAGRRRLMPVSGETTLPTNDMGRYRSYGLPPGQYLLGTRASGYALTYFPGTMNASEALLVPVGWSQDVPNIDFSLLRTRTVHVSGTALDASGQPLKGRIQLNPSNPAGISTLEPLFTASVRVDGTFDFANVAPGDYLLQAIGNRPNQSPAGDRPEGEFASRYLSVGGRGISGLTIQASKGSTVSGRIVIDGDVYGLRYQDVTLVAWSIDFDRSPMTLGLLAYTRPRADWTFELVGLTGPRVLRFLTAPSGWSMKAIRLNGVDITDTPVTFGSKDQSLTDVEIVVTNRAAEVSGSVTDERGRPNADYAVIVFSTNQERWSRESRFLKYTRPSQDGSFVVRGLPPAAYFVAAVDWVQGNEWQDPTFLQSLTARATRISLSDGQRVLVSPKLIAR
jgi:protocatechuate 3,4-dioxygenase beta subunit